MEIDFDKSEDCVKIVSIRYRRGDREDSLEKKDVRLHLQKMRRGLING